MARLAEVLQLTAAQFKKLDTRTKKEYVRVIAKGLNKNLQRIREVYDDDDIPALRGLKQRIDKQRMRGNWGPKDAPVDRFSVKGLNDDQLLGQFNTAKWLAGTQTGTLRGANKAISKQMQSVDAIIYMSDEDKKKGISQKDWYSKLSKTQKSDFWKLYRRLEDDENLAGTMYQKGSDELVDEVHIAKTVRPSLTVSQLFNRMKNVYEAGEDVNYENIRWKNEGKYKPRGRIVK